LRIRKVKPTKAQLKFLEILEKNPNVLVLLKGGRRIGLETYNPSSLIEFMKKKLKIKANTSQDG